MLEKIGPYEFKGVLGRGGMGSVYRGRHRETGEIHAVKILAQNFSDDSHFRDRFESEIRALIKLDHPNIVRILSYGQEMGNLYFAMELVEGYSLFQMQKKGHRFDWREIMTLGKQVAKGLRHAHDRGIIHRDLKPGNLLMPFDNDGNRGEVKITDFGIAKRFGNSQNTGENVLGTMDFMSPEQAKGQPVSVRSDLYSLGTVMYTLLSGRPPFSGNSVEESLRNLTRVPAPNIASVVPDVPFEVDKLIQKLMDKRPEKRIPTAQALLFKIEEIENQLLQSSQAQTADAARPTNDETFDVALPSEIATQISTNRRRKKQSAVSGTASEAAPTVESGTDESHDQSAQAGRKVDYFNTVTEHIRQQQEHESANQTAPSHRSKGLILFALLTVIGLATYGTYNAFQPRSAEILYAEIESNLAQPQLALDAIDEFLKFYPDDPRADQVQAQQKIGSAIRFYNRLANKLSVRGNLPGESRLTKIEKQFLKMVELSQDDPELAAAKMAALVTVHRGPELTERDRLCLVAAGSYQIKLLADARAESIWKLQRIRDVMDSAAQETDANRAAKIYQSILELFRDEMWDSSDEGVAGSQLVKKAKRLFEDKTEEAQQQSVDAQAGGEQVKNEAPTKSENDLDDKKELENDSKNDLENGLPILD